MKKLLLVSSLVAWFISLATAAPLGTAFTYQGKLADAGQPANGNYDLKFTAYDTPFGGSIMGGPLTNAANGVSNGLFTVALDFGAGVFTSNARWLQIAVRTNGSASDFTTLAPRQPLTPSPYALYAPSAGNAATATTATTAANLSGNVADAQLSPNIARLNGTNNFTGTNAFAGVTLATNVNNVLVGLFTGNGAGLTNLSMAQFASAVLTNGQSGVVLSGTFAGTGAALTNLNGAMLVPGSVPASALAPGAVTHLDSPGGGPTNVVAVAANGYVGVRTNAPRAALHVAGGMIADSFQGDGSGLQNLDSINLTGALALKPSFLSKASLSTTCQVFGVAAAGNYAYLACGTNGVRVYDVSDISAPVYVSQTNNGGYASGATISGTCLFLANGSDGLRVYSLSDPARPASVGNAVPGYVLSVVVAGNYAYAVVSSVGLRIYDISQPASPTLIGSWNNSAIAQVAVDGNWVYAACGYSGLYILNVANPASPLPYFSSVGGSWVGAVAVANNFAYLACGTSQGRICDVTNPSSPTLAGSFSGPGDSLQRVALVERMLCVGGSVYCSPSWPYFCYVASIFYDLSQPRSPAYVGWLYLDDVMRNAAGANGFAFVADGTTNVFLASLYGASAEVFKGTTMSLSGGLSAQGVSASYFNGNGSGLTGVNAASVSPSGLASGNVTNAVNFLSSAGVGIGKTDPATALDVNGTVTATDFSGNGSGLTSLNAASLSGNVSSAVNFLSSAGVGIGTSSPSGALLDVEGDIRLNNHVLWLRDGIDSGHGLGYFPQNTFGSGNPDGPVLFGCNGGTLGSICGGTNMALHWFSDGRVIIDPSGLNAGSPTPGLSFGANSGEGIASKRTAGGNQFGLDFYVNYLARMSIANNGNVGIGTNTPQTALHVVGTVTASAFQGSGVVGWSPAASTSVAMQPNSGYVATNDLSPTVFTLPAAPALGDIVRVSGGGAGTWRISQNASQRIRTRNMGGAAGNNWTARGFSRGWTGIAASADGIKLTACDNGGNIYTSTNSGLGWVSRASSQAWSSIASSSDGVKLAGCVSGGTIYVSADSGASWTSRGSTLGWQHIASSDDGTKLVACVYGGWIYTSSDSGTNWTARDSSRNWYSVASSADGTKLVAVVFNGQIYTSINSGASWTPRDSTRYWIDVASSADGAKLTAVVSDGYIYTSTDSGVTWTQRSDNVAWTCVASSADGTRLVAGSAGTRPLYVSTDSGVSWATHDTLHSWSCAASSADGTKMFVGCNIGYIYASVSETTSGTGGYLTGDMDTSIELQFIGNNIWVPLNHEGTILSH